MAKAKRYTAATRKAVFDRYRRGESTLSISKDLGMSHVTIIRWLRAAKIPRRPAKRPYTEELPGNAHLPRDIRKLLVEGYSPKTIRELLGITKKIYVHIAKRAKIDLEKYDKQRREADRPPTTQKDVGAGYIRHHLAIPIEKQREIKKLRLKGLTYDQIAAESGLERKTVWRYLLRLELTN